MADPIRQLTVTPTLTALIKDVLGPSAKLLGTELKCYLKEKLDEAKERRREKNLTSHITAVRDSIRVTIPEQASYKQLDTFNDWIDGAQDVGDDEPTLTQMWRRLLRRLIEGQSPTQGLIDVMKKVDSPMAGLLVGFRERRKQPLLVPIFAT